MKKYSLILFLLGIGSFIAGPFASVPGVILGWRLEDRGTLGQFGYGVCWIFTGLFAAVCVFGFLSGFTFYFWKAYVQ